MNILITGVAGLLGSRLADWIINNIPNVNVIGIDDLSGGYAENVHFKVKFYKCDVNSEEVKNIFDFHNIDIVYHFAAYAAEGLSPFIRKFNYENNLLSTVNIINNCINYNVKRLVFTSSMAVYGKGTPPFTEDDQPNPIDPYGVAKYACELDIKIAGEQHNLDWCIIRPHNVYGINQNIWDKYRNVLGIWMRQHLNNEQITIFGDGSQKRAFSFIDDCLKPLWLAGTSEKASKKIINLGGKKEYSILEAASILNDVITGVDIKFLEQRHEVKNAHSTWQKSVDILEYKENTSLHDGLKQMWEWAKITQVKDIFIWDKYEVEKGIYKFWKNNPKITIAIPCGEMNNLGKYYLEFSLDRIEKQTYDNIEIYISDQSTNDIIKDFISQYKSKYKIIYEKIDHVKRNASANTNYIMKSVSPDSKYIKILFQDDFLCDENAMSNTVEEFEKHPNKFWMATGCLHSRNGNDLYNKFEPYFYKEIYTGQPNSISSPSVITIRNTNDKVYFDEELVFLMDVDFYRRLYDKFGDPVILKTPTAVNRIHDTQVGTATSEDVRKWELNHVSNKFEN